MNSSTLQKIGLCLQSLENEMQSASLHLQEMIAQLPQNQQLSAQNLIHYLVLRNTSIQELQYHLHEFGLSSLASCESHTLRQIQVTRERLGEVIQDPSPVTQDWGNQRIEDARAALFGPIPKDWHNSVMVTFDRSFVEDIQLVEVLLQNGMSVARINCAHDEEVTWIKMVETLQKASKNTGIPCKVHVDLAGPKLRTKLLKRGKNSGKTEVKKGDVLWLADSGKGFGDKDLVVSPEEDGVISSLKVGERVFFDDGLILGRIDKLSKGGAKVLIERVSTKKSQLKNEKGINFPDSDLAISSLTEFDESCLPFAMKYADLIGFSFVRRPKDINELREKMKGISSRTVPIILKIETPESVNHLPELLWEGMKEQVFGVMIARGDLAVEVGFERLVEIQEEISWICEAAHVPVIWATQVLENLHKSGVASRAEITDAGRAAQAECIMINKGDHTMEVLRSLKEITQKSRALKVKNRLIFRPLKIAGDFLQKFRQ